ncbi:MAG: ABC transporter substrate-binding protein, partial [Actinomycetia bacterium]|nr:ABC transporter substrate-binding protein [Actinomycetes bacterium]
PEHIWKDIEDPFNYSTEDALTGTGPFTLADYSPSEGSYLFEANQDYYGGKVNIDSIAFVKVVPETSASMLQSNNIDAAAIPADIADDTQQKGFILEQEPPVWAAKLLINHENNELLAREPVRQALAYAVNLEQIVEISQRGFAVKGSAGLMPPANSSWYNPEVFQYRFDRDKAKKILEEHGYQLKQDGYYYSGGRILKLELAVSQGDFERDAQIIKSNLEEAGIKIDLVSYEGKTLDSKIENWDFDLAISGHGGLGGDPEALNRVITGQDFNSVRYFKDEHLVNLLEAQVQEMDIRKRRQMVYQIQDLYSQHLPSITLYYAQWYWAHNQKADIFFTPGGIALGIPLPLNKIAFID